MSNYKIMEDESDAVIHDVDHVSIARIHVLVDHERKDEINLNFNLTTIADFFSKLPCSEENRINIKKDIIKILSENKNSLLNKLVKLALADLKVIQHLKNREIGQFMVEPEHFDRKDYRDNLK